MYDSVGVSEDAVDPACERRAQAPEYLISKT